MLESWEAVKGIRGPAPFYQASDFKNRFHPFSERCLLFSDFCPLLSAVCPLPTVLCSPAPTLHIGSDFIMLPRCCDDGNRI